MNTNQPPRIFDDAYATAEGSMAKNFVANVFSWMVVGLLLTAFVASYAASSGLYEQFVGSVDSTHLLAYETVLDLVCSLMLVNNIVTHTLSHV